MGIFNTLLDAFGVDESYSQPTVVTTPKVSRVGTINSSTIDSNPKMAVNVVTTPHSGNPDNRIQSVFDKTINPASNNKETIYFNYGLGLEDFNNPNNTYASLLTAIQQEAQTKQDYYRKMDMIKDYDYIESIIRDVGTDVLTKSYNSDTPFFNFFIKNEKYKNLENKVNEDIQRLNIYGWLTDIIDNLLLYGQYILKIDYKNNELDDRLIQENTLPTYSKGDIKKVYTTEIKNNIKENGMTQGKLYDEKEFFILTLFTTYKNLPIVGEDGNFYTIKLPKGIIPESIIPKIIYLKLLESLQPLIELQAMDQKMFFYIRFPTGHDVTEAYKAVTRYEKYLKSILNLDNIDISDVNSILEQVSTVKVIPLFGDQSQMEPQTIEKINRIDLSQIEDLRNSISSALKININGDNTSNTQYLKLIKRLRLMIRDSISASLINYIKVVYRVTLTDKDFELIVPEVYGTEDLDTIEYLNLHLSSFRDTLDISTLIANTLSEVLSNNYIDSKNYLEMCRNKSKSLFGIDIFKENKDLGDVK